MYDDYDNDDYDDDDDDDAVQINMLLLDNNMIIYVKFVICLIVVASIGSSLPPKSAYIEFGNIYFTTIYITKICTEFLNQLNI